MNTSVVNNSCTSVNNYDMTDREDNYSDFSDSEDDDSPKKHVPTWAQKPNLDDALRAQVAADPDEIFPGMPKSCDLEGEHCVLICRGSLTFFMYLLSAIFGRKKFRPRTSSARWSPDHFTPREEFHYKMHMGFMKKK